MNKKQGTRARAISWKHYDRKGYSAFASMGKLIRIGVLSVATLGTICPVRAEQGARTEETKNEPDDKELQEVTITGTMAPLTQLQSARIVSVVSRAEVEQAGVQSVNDLLKLVSSVDVRQRGGFGIQTDISIDGGTYEQVTILLNGVNINNPHTGHLTVDLPVTVADIERIEVLEGAASRVYGGQAFGGAINIVTRKDAQRQLSVGLQGGSHGTVLGDGRVTATHGRVQHHVSGSGGRSDGGTLNDAWKKGTLYYQGGLDHEAATLDWQFGFSRKEYGANTFYSGSSNDQWEQNERYMISLGAETKGKIHVLPSVYWNRTYDNYDWHRGTTTNSHQSDVYGARLGSYVSWIAGKTAVGAELRSEGILSSSLGNLMEEADWVNAHGSDLQYTHKANRTNVAFNLEHDLVLNRWTVSAGVVANMNTMVDSKFRFYPGVDIAFRPATAWKLFVGYNKGFRLPSYTDLYYSSPDITGNDQLKPEENHSLNVGATLHLTNGIQGKVRFFYSHGHNMIDYVKAEYGDAAHADNFDTDNLGVGTEWQVDFHQLISEKCLLNNLSVGYTYMHQDRDGKYEIFTSLYASDYLRHKLTASLCHRIWSALSATWSLRYQKRMGEYQVYDGLTATSELKAYKPYATLDLKLQWTKPKYEVFVQGTNLTNRRYQDLGNVRQPGIWIMAGARWRMNF